MDLILPMYSDGVRSLFRHDLHRCSLNSRFLVAKFSSLGQDLALKSAKHTLLTLAGKSKRCSVWLDRDLLLARKLRLSETVVDCYAAPLTIA